VDIYVECLLSLGVGVWGLVGWGGSPSPIAASPTFHLRSADASYSQPEIRAFNHRGRALKARNKAAKQGGGGGGGGGEG